MNVGSLQALMGSTQQFVSPVGNATSSNKFGSVFSSVIANDSALGVPLEESVTDATTVESIMAIFNATKIEEIAEVLGTDKVVGQLDELPDADIEQLIENITPLFEKAGLSESELTNALNVNGVWPLLGMIEKVGPQFFEVMTNALEGKGVIPKGQAVELLALLKSMTIAAPQPDLLMKQEQQIFSLQGFLAVLSERIESTNHATQNRSSIGQLMETHYAIKVVPQTQTGQNSSNGENLKDSPKETAQPVFHQLLGTKSEMTLTELENRNNSRNEVLLREMQDVFKRSNFGQAGGTNRLLIKLYPEHLGQVRIELLQVNGVMTARILASTALGKEMLDSQLHQLRSAFLQQNLQVDRIDISQTLQDASRNERDQAFNQHFRREQENSDEHEKQNTEEEMTFQEYMIELEV